MLVCQALDCSTPSAGLWRPGQRLLWPAGGIRRPGRRLLGPAGLLWSGGLLQRCSLSAHVFTARSSSRQVVAFVIPARLTDLLSGSDFHMNRFDSCRCAWITAYTICCTFLQGGGQGYSTGGYDDNQPTSGYWNGALQPRSCQPAASQAARGGKGMTL